MNEFGQLCLLGAMVGSGYAAFACVAGTWRDHRAMVRGGMFAGIASVVLLTVVGAVLAWALVAADFRFAYVAQYSSQSLPWYYALSALWAGQSGSLLTWAWFLGVLALAYAFLSRREPHPIRGSAIGILMGCLCFLVTVMVFAADPMQASIGAPQTGEGLSPLLQHPVMMIHPPVIFLGYAAWTVPFALALASLIHGRTDAAWTRDARSWALGAWIVLGAGIILGGEWAYEELGWGGYWAWDPVENGSLIPWLTGTAMLHGFMVWQYRGGLKKTTLALAVLTFGLCNFATFLTRSGIFSSVHAFSQSPIGWMFLALMVGIVVVGGILILWRRETLRAEHPIAVVSSRESLVLLAILALTLLALVVLVGTLALPLSNLFLGRSIVLGHAFYNNVAIPIGLILLGAVTAASLLRWGRAPTAAQRRTLLLSTVIGGVAALAAFGFGVAHPVTLVVVGLAVATCIAVIGTLLLDVRLRSSQQPDDGTLRATGNNRRQYAGYLIHVGFALLAVGIAGSSLGSRDREVVLPRGETVEWAGYSVRFTGLIERELPGKFVEEARLEISRRGRPIGALLPAQHWYPEQGQWTTEVAILSTWSGDLFTTFHGSDEQGRINLSLIENPMIRWLWLGSWIFGLGALIRLWPRRRGTHEHPSVPPPKHRRAFQSSQRSTRKLDAR